jgi:hypothetical protein
MNTRALLLLCLLMPVAAIAQQPPGVNEALHTMVSEPGSHTAFTFDKDMLQFADGFIDNGSAPVSRDAIAALDSITVERYSYHEPAFYLPEQMHAIEAAYAAAGWKHLVNANGPSSPGRQSSPQHPITDMWLHFRGTQIDDVTVLVRAPRQMALVEVSGSLRPLDLVHLSGHFGIPKVDPGAVMVPARP